MTDIVSTGVVPVTAPLSPTRLAVRRFTQHRLAVAGAIVLLLLVLVAVFGPLLYPVDPNAVDVFASRKPPSAEHPLGTDSAGRDVVARLLSGGRVSLTVALAATIGAAAIGAILERPPATCADRSMRPSRGSRTSSCRSPRSSCSPRSSLSSDRASRPS